MDQDPKRPSSSRENILAVALTVLVAVIALFYLYLITLGIVLNVLGVAGGIIVLALVHYVLWGRSMSADVTAERDAMLRHEEQEALPKPRVSADAIQDISRTQAIKK